MCMWMCMYIACGVYEKHKETQRKLHILKTAKSFSHMCCHQLIWKHMSKDVMIVLRVRWNTAKYTENYIFWNMLTLLCSWSRKLPQLLSTVALSKLYHLLITVHMFNSTLLISPSTFIVIHMYSEINFNSHIIQNMCLTHHIFIRILCVGCMRGTKKHKENYIFWKLLRVSLTCVVINWFENTCPKTLWLCWEYVGTLLNTQKTTYFETCLHCCALDHENYHNFYQQLRFPNSTTSLSHMHPEMHKRRETYL